jgi:CHRD domain
MIRRVGRTGGALSLLALLALVAAGFATAGSPPALPGKVSSVPTHAAASPALVPAIALRLTAKLAPSSGASTPSGRWDGLLAHTFGRSQLAPGCVPVHSIGTPGGAGQVTCGRQLWVLGWKVSYTGLSSPVTGADIRFKSSVGAAPVVAVALCGPCSAGKLTRTTLTEDQARALLKGNGSVVLRTTNNPDGEISGQIVRVKPTPVRPAHH